MHRERPSTPSSYESYSSSSTSSESSKKRLSTIQSVLQEARATIHNPSRPYTPRDTNRRLFTENDYLVRPQSAYSISSSNFDVKLTPILKKPLSAGSRRLLNIIDEARQQEGDGASQKIDTNKISGDHQELSDSQQVESYNWRSIQSLLAIMARTSDIETILDSADSVFVLLNQFDDKGVVFDEEESITNSILTKHDTSVQEDRKRIILYTVSKLMDHPNPRVLLKISAIILKICPEGLFLLSTCKLLFKLSKVEQNDILFREEKILQLLANVLEKHCDNKINLSSEIMIYTIATLKNVSHHPENQQILLSSKIIAIFSSLLTAAYLYLRKTTEHTAIDQQAQLLVQLTATLRNVAVSSSTFKKIAECEVIPSSIRLMEKLQGHSEFIHNTSRVLSKVSLERKCKDAILLATQGKSEGYDPISIMIHVLTIHKKHKPIVIRLCFVLGNITYSHLEARKTLGTEENISFLLELLNIYNKEHLDLIKASIDGDNKKLQVETEDLLLKLVRLIANIALDHHSAVLILAKNEIVLLLSIIERLNLKQHEELVLNIVRCITNLSFYGVNKGRDDNSSQQFELFSDAVRVAQILAPMVSYDHVDAVYESVRAYGNLSHDTNVRKWMAENRLDEMMVVLLSHSQVDVVQSACGVIINLTSDPETNDLSIPMLLSNNIVSKLFDLLDHCHDILLFDTLLKTLHNQILVARDELFSEEHIMDLQQTLPEFLNHILDEISEEDYSKLELVSMSLLNALVL